MCPTGSGTSSSAQTAARDTSSARARALALTALAAVVALAVVYLVAVQTTRGQRLDESASIGRYVAERAHDSTHRILSTISITSLALVGGGLALVALLRRRPHLALAALVLIAGSVLTTEILKHVVLPRPDLLATREAIGGASFPSGHTTVAMSLALAAVIVVPRSARGLVAGAGTVYAVAVGVAVVSAGWHRPSDVYGAYLVTYAWAAATTGMLVARYSSVRTQTERRTRGVVLLAVGLALLAVALFAASAVIIEQRRSGFAVAGPGWNFAVATIAIAAVGTGLTGLLVRLLRAISLDAPLDAPPRGSR